MKILAIIVLILFFGVVGFLVYKTLKSLKPKPKQIKIPLVNNGKETGTWIECLEGDMIHTQLTKVYGNPLPLTIEIEPYKPE